MATTGAAFVTLVLFGGCASLRSSHRLDHQIAQADVAYHNLDAEHVPAYNHAVESIARQLDGAAPDDFRSRLDLLEVKLDQPRVKLPLARYHVAPRSHTRNQPNQVGVPMLLDYDTSNAPLYLRDGLAIAATAAYRPAAGKPEVSLTTGRDRVKLNGSTYPLNIDNAAPITAMGRRGRHVARAGFWNMLHPAAMPEGPRIFLTEPNNPNKITVLIIPGVAIDALRLGRPDEGHAARPGGEQAFSSVDIPVCHGQAGLLARSSRQPRTEAVS